MATSPTEFGEMIGVELRQTFLPPGQQYGEELRGEMRDLISVPVERVGGRVIRSKPFEAPRMETKALWRSMNSRASIEGKTIRIRMWSDDAVAGYAGYLEENLNRPHFSTIAARAEQYAVDRILALAPDRF